MSALDRVRGLHRGVWVPVVALLAVAVIALSYWQVRAVGRSAERVEARAAAKPSPSTLPYDHQPTLLVVGDDYTASYPTLVADKMGWNLAVDAQDDTGFVHAPDNHSPAHAPFVDRLERDASAYNVDYVLIDGGRNDFGNRPEPVAAAADEYIRRVQAKWPKAKVIMVLPISITEGAPAPDPGLAQALRHTAESLGAEVIDPAAQGWFTDVDPKSLMWKDGKHLNANGNVYYGDKITENLKQLFDTKPTVLVVGDSFAGGTGDPRFRTYPHQLADRMGWNLALDAVGGTGFVHSVDNVTPPHRPFIDRLGRDMATYRNRVDYILIDGGRNDLGLMPQPVVDAADKYFKDVRAHWPNAKIVVMLPAYATTQSATNFPVLAEGFRRSAESIGAYVIDPVAQRWYHSVDVKSLIGDDGIHFNGPGNAYYTDRIVENLKQLGVA